jgi:hypothetical protein
MNFYFVGTKDQTIDDIKKIKVKMVACDTEEKAIQKAQADQLPVFKLETSYIQKRSMTVTENGDYELANKKIKKDTIAKIYPKPQNINNNPPPKEVDKNPKKKNEPKEKTKQQKALEFLEEQEKAERASQANYRKLYIGLTIVSAILFNYFGGILLVLPLLGKVGLHFVATGSITAFALSISFGALVSLTTAIGINLGSRLKNTVHNLMRTHKQRYDDKIMESARNNINLENVLDPVKDKEFIDILNELLGKSFDPVFDEKGYYIGVQPTFTKLEALSYKREWLEEILQTPPKARLMREKEIINEIKTSFARN